MTAIIIPTCNRPVLLSACLKSCVNQAGFSNVDHIYVINDGEPGSVDISEYSSNSTLIEHCKPYYAKASALNVGISTALSDGHKYGLMIDDDVVLLPGTLEQHRSNWRNTPQTIYAGAIRQNVNCVDIRLRYMNHVELVSGLKRDLKGALIKYGGTANASFRLDVLLDAGGFNERFDGQWGFEDSELFGRLIVRDGWEYVYIEEAVAIHNGRQSAAHYYNHQTFDKNKTLYRELMAKYQSA